MNEFNAMLSELEEMRKKVIPKFIICIGIIACGFLNFMVLPMANLGSAVIVLGFGTFITGVIMMAVWAEPARKEYATVYKRTIVTKVMSEKIDKLSYEPRMGFPKEFISGTGFMVMGNRYKTEDLITGSYKDVNFRRADVVIEDHRSNGKNSYTVTYFKGRWMVFNFNKNFSKELQIIQRGFGYTNKKKSIFTAAANRRHKVEFENEQFNNMYECLCQDEQEAFYLITPHIQEALMNFNRVIDGKLMLGFRGNVVNVAIENGKDMLEPSLFKTVSYENDVLPILQERNVIQNFVDIINIDRNIFK